MSKDVLLQIGQISPDDANESSQFPAAGVASDETDLLKKQEKRLITHVIEKTDGDRTKSIGDARHQPHDPVAQIKAAQYQRIRWSRIR
ncbi:sigma-54 dependent transcriptional regulator [Klebsiella michiganensis]|uniref:Sigma-54 dependent transcriptional regulator n=1 Tax=Klebsiella michiganensis TaxID=1134687 RepID=A0A7H4PG21_9ENTR|nr:sigma-54 dependent transcriptional regulator [Klebsiella michiganensis]